MIGPVQYLFGSLLLKQWNILLATVATISYMETVVEIEGLLLRGIMYVRVRAPAKLQKGQII